MKFLFNYKIITAHVCRSTVMFKIFVHHLVCYISRTPGAIANRPKMSTPILFPKSGKLFLEATRCSAFQSFYKVTYRRWREDTLCECAHGLYLQLLLIFLHLQIHKFGEPKPYTFLECLLSKPSYRYFVTHTM